MLPGPTDYLVTVENTNTNKLGIDDSAMQYIIARILVLVYRDRIVIVYTFLFSLRLHLLAFANTPYFLIYRAVISLGVLE